MPLGTEPANDQGGHPVLMRVSICDRDQSLDHLEFGLDRLILTAGCARSFVLDRLLISCIFGQTHTRSNVSVQLR